MLWGFVVVTLTLTLVVAATLKAIKNNNRFFRSWNIISVDAWVDVDVNMNLNSIIELQRIYEIMISENICLG